MHRKTAPNVQEPVNPGPGETEPGDPIPHLLSSTDFGGIAIDTTKLQRPVQFLESDSTEYFGNFVFENGKPSKYLFQGGYYSYTQEKNAGSSPYHYYIADHLGSVRMVVNGDGTVEQVNHYYPFGTPYADAGLNPSFQKIKYSGKELDLTHGLNTYDHGARQNYPLLGVWDRVDLIAENYPQLSPYSICGNNPVNNIDFDGNDYWTTSDKELIYDFINAVGRGQTQYDFSQWHHSSDGDFVGKLTYDDEAHKFYTSYSEIKNNEIYVVGKIFSALCG